MSEIRELKRKLTGIFLLCLVMVILPGCGDDAEITVGTMEDLVREPVGAETGTGEDSPNTGQTSPGAAGQETQNTVEGQASADSAGDGQSTADRAESGEGMSGQMVPELVETVPGEIWFTISAAGDVTLGNYFGQDYAASFRQMWEEKQDPSYFFQNVLDIFSEDSMTLVNLEGPLTKAEERREDKTYCISGDPEYVKILTAGNVEAVGMANNHREDYFEQGSDDTVEAVKAAGIVYAYDGNYGIYESQGIKAGIISVSVLNSGRGVEKFIEKGMEYLEEQEADLILVSCHWGIEREFYPEDYQKELGRKCIDMGADLVIGHHPHVLQGVEEYNGKYIVYSLGNFCFGANRNPSDKDCIIFQQSFLFKDGEKSEETNARIIPCSISSVSNRNDYCPTPADGEQKQRILDRMNLYSTDFGLQFDEDGRPVSQEDR